METDMPGSPALRANTTLSYPTRSGGRASGRPIVRRIDPGPLCHTSRHVGRCSQEVRCPPVAAATVIRGPSHRDLSSYKWTKRGEYSDVRPGARSTFIAEKSGLKGSMGVHDLPRSGVLPQDGKDCRQRWPDSRSDMRGGRELVCRWRYFCCQLRLRIWKVTDVVRADGGSWKEELP